MKYTILTLSTLLLFAGCMPQDAQPVKKQVISKEQNKSKVIQNNTPPPPPKKEIELKEVQDTNYNDAYMYPQTPAKKEKVAQSDSIPVSVAAGSIMGKQECIAMISQEKFDKYTAIFGSEDASIKRCNMIRSMSQ